MTVNIRPAAPADLPVIVRMIQQLHVHVGTSEPPKVSVDILQSDGPFGHRNFDILVAEIDGGLAGVCLYSFSFSGWRGKSGIFVEDLYVDPAARGSGIGRQMLITALEREAGRGAAFLKLEVTTTNSGAVAFYRKCGFEIAESEVIMTLR